MRIAFDEYDAAGPVTVTLSRKNLLAGLHKLEMEGSARTLVSGDGWVTLKFETDEEHYADREPAGIMHPETEQAISRCGPWVGDVCQKCGRVDVEL